ncbi:Cellulose synthase subunit D [Azotobacter beijerinckii]|uniref:Cellulose synthase subunit D n=1 Tax=Azotobacter beijerinckii TaxID=170623 RepID=A0A1H6TRE0_9GAMM|nr:cellulose biosynthesis protein BcsD [Azotobacter beijerinckii]SEI51943.1 Cellulose synthase subunit D [Azotobacter beijerinckii]SEI81836.1 Cellulose synthase subunit D [Azotobacter beijerinckii]
MIAESDIQASNLAYYGDRHNNKQWRQFVLTLITEMYSTAGSVDACSFLRHVGSRIAAANPLKEQPSLQALEAALNGILGELDWGWVRLSTDNRSIRIVHGAYPGILETSDSWHQAIAAVLEGMHENWIQAQNEEVRLSVKCIDIAQHGALVFSCGG